WVGGLRQDALAGLVVGIVALPLSMALAIAVGAPPQHGLYTAVVAGFVVALTGGSKHQVTGPTAAFIVILAPIVAKYGLSGLLTAGPLGGGPPPPPWGPRPPPPPPARPPPPGPPPPPRRAPPARGPAGSRARR